MRLRRSAMILLASGILFTAMAQERQTAPEIANEDDELLEKARAEDDAEDQALAEDDALQRSAPGASFPSSVRGPFPNVQLPGEIVAPEGQVTVFANFPKAEPKGGSVPLYLINRSGETLNLPSQDGDLYFKLEFQTPRGRWERAQNHIGSWCGLSYFPLTLKPGQYFVLQGYFPSGGEPALVRYRCYSGKGSWTSNAGSGFYLPADQNAAALDDLARSDGPQVLWKTIDPRWGTSDRPLWLGEQLAAVALRSIYGESKAFRRVAGRWALRWPAEAQAERKALQAVLDQPWPADPQSGALFERCLAVVSAQGAPEKPTAPAPGTVQPVLAWRVISELLDDPELPDRPASVKRAYAALDVAFASSSSSIQSAAAVLLDNQRLTDELLTTERVKSWIGSGSLEWLSAISSILARRWEVEWLVEWAGPRPPEEQLVVLKALAQAPPPPFRSGDRFRDPIGQAECRFWEHCARTHPLETVSILYELGVSGDPPVNAFDRTLHDTLRDFLAVEAKRTDGPAKSDLFPLSRVVEFVGGWRQSEDAPVFRDFLRHPGYESSQVTSSEEPTHYEERRYRVRAAAKTALMAMGEPVPEGVVLEEKIVGTAK